MPRSSSSAPAAGPAGPGSSASASARRSRGARSPGLGIGARVVADSGEIDVHTVPPGAAAAHRWQLPPLTGALNSRRRWLGLTLALVGVPVVTALLLSIGDG